MQITFLLSNVVQIYIFALPLPSPRTLQQKCAVSSGMRPMHGRSSSTSLSAVMVKACGSFAQSRDLKKHEGAHLGPSRCGKSHERLLLGSKLPRLASPNTRRHPDEYNNQKQAPKKDLFARRVCVPTFSYTSFAVYYRTSSTHIYLCLAFSLNGHVFI